MGLQSLPEIDFDFVVITRVRAVDDYACAPTPRAPQGVCDVALGAWCIACSLSRFACNISHRPI